MLENIELFAGLSVKELEEIEAIAKRVNYNRGEIIFGQGDFARDLFVIEAGQVEISVKDFLATSQSVAVLKNGEFFGEMALFDKSSVRSATARTLQNTVIIVIPGDDFHRLLHQKPAISFKLLGALSRRLKESNTKVVTAANPGKNREGRTLLVASAQNGYGKTTFATTLAHLLTAERGKKVLYIDLDTSFAEGTFYLGVVSPKCLLNMANAIVTGIGDLENFEKHICKIGDRLAVLPAPNNLLDGEKVTGKDVAGILKLAKKFYDYVIVDTDSNIGELFLNAFDMADHVFFLVETSDLLSIKNSNRYFQGISKLNYPQEKTTTLASKVKKDFQPGKMADVLKHKITGGLPLLTGHSREFGKTVFQTNPTSHYCNSLRYICQMVLKEEFFAPQKLAEKQTEKGKNFFMQFFFESDDIQTFSEVVPHFSFDPAPVMEKELALPDEILSVLLKYIRTSIMFGNLDDAKSQTLKLLEFCQGSSTLFQLLGETFWAEQNYSQGIDAFKKSLEIDPANHIAMGYLASLTKDPDLHAKTMDLLKQKIEKNPKYPDLHNDLGKLLMRSGQTETAIPHFEKALSINPRYLESKINLAVSLGELHRFEGAINQLMEVQPKNIRIYYLLGNLFFSTGQFAEALNAFSLAADINGNYFDVCDRLSKLREYFKRLSTLLEMHRELLSNQKTYPDLHYKVGSILLLLGRREEASREFEAALELNPKYDRARVSLEKIKAMPVFHLPMYPEVSGRKPGSGKGTSLGRLSLELEIEENLLDFEPDFFKTKFFIKVKNIRTGKFVNVESDPASIVKGKVNLDITTLGHVAPYDVLLVQLADLASRKIISALPHSVSEADITSERVAVKFSVAFRQMMSEAKALPPVRYFLFNLQSPTLAGTLTGDVDGYKAVIYNPGTGVSAHGLPNPENENEVNFILVSKGGEDVVRLNDKLQLKVLNQKNSEVFSMDFSVAQDNLENFSKSVLLEDPGSGFTLA